MAINEQKRGAGFSLRTLPTLLANAGLDAFLLALVGMIFLAYFYPSPGLAEKPFSLETVTDYGLSLIFFFYGLRLSFADLRAGLGNWQLHAGVQLTTFLFFPLAVLPFKPLFPAESAALLWLGAFFLAALPSTVSSSVVMVSIANGNLPAAIFNATVSSVLGIFITPLWMSFFLAGGQEERQFDLQTILLKLGWQVLLPFAAGVALNPILGAFANRHKKKLRYFDQTVILLIVYTAFCHSFALRIFSAYGAGEIIALGAAMAGLFFLSYAFIFFISRILRFSRADTITLLFCGSKKSLVHGTMMSKVLFETSSAAGILLLPLMIYHAVQLIFASIIARRLARQTKIKVEDD